MGTKAKTHPLLAPPGLFGAFILAGALLGAFEGALLDTREAARVIALAAAMGVVPALLAALAVFATLCAAALALHRLGLDDRIVPRGELDRKLVLRATAHVISVTSVLAVVYAVSAPALRFLFELQVISLARDLITALTLLLVAAGVPAMLLLARLLISAFHKLEARGRLPLPSRAWALWLSFVMVPVCVPVYLFVRKHGAMLSWGRDVLTVLLLACLGIQLTLVMRPISAKARRTLSAVLIAMAALALAAADRLHERWSNSARAADDAFLVSLGTRAARSLTDFDRDGASSLFAGGDCAALDGARAPSQAEIPGNGIDEDCNGSDEVGEAFAVERFSRALEPAQVKNYNVVLVIIDSLRADRVVGPAARRMPFFTELARESLLFTRAYAQTTTTALSIPSILSGIDPATARWERKGLPQMSPDEIMLAERLAQRGYRTGFVLDTYLYGVSKGSHQGFEDLLLGEPPGKRRNNRPRRNPIATAQAASFLATLAPGQPFFLVVYYPDPHAPYTRHPDITAKLDPGEIGDYDSELVFSDQELRALVEIVRSRQSLWNDTIFIVTADHGEEFGDHGGTQHSKTCWIEVVHVPLLVRIPGLSPATVKTPVGLIDIVPTVLELVGAREDLDRLGGQSLLVPALRPEEVHPNRPLFCTIPSLSDKYGTYFHRAVRTPERTLVQDVNRGSFSLFDTARDRAEREDVSHDPAYAPELAALKTILQASLTGNLRDHTQELR